MKLILKFLLVGIFLVYNLASLRINASEIYSPEYMSSMSEPWRWQKFPELSGKGCRCMIEDQDGSLWFGINGGILRYNGIKWDFYPINNDTTGIPVIALCAASNGTLYIGTSEGISSFRNGKWKMFNIDLEFGDRADFPNNRFPIIESSDKSIWVGTHQGVLRIKDEVINLYCEKSFWQNLQNMNFDYREIKAFPKFNIFSIFEEKPGVIWFGLRDGRIFQCRLDLQNLNSQPSWRRIDTENGYLRARFPLITNNEEGKLFICSGEIRKGVNIFDGQHWSQFEFLQAFNINDVHSDILKSRNNTILIGISGDVIAYSAGKWSICDKPVLPLPLNRWFLYETKDGNLWIIGLSSEVWRVGLSFNKWITYKGIQFQVEKTNGEKWFLMYDNAIVKADSSMETWIRYDQKDGLIDTPVAIEITKSGQIWVMGSHRQSAATACLNNEKWYKQIHAQLSWGIDRRAFCEATNGSLWFGSSADLLPEKNQKGGLVRYLNHVDFNADPEYDYYYFNDSFKLSAIYGIEQSADGILWTGENTLYKFNSQRNQWESMSKPARIDESFIDCINTSPEGNLWIGTRANGIYFYHHQTEEWTQYTINNGLSSNSIISILARSDTNVWVATDQNICHFDGKSWTNNVFTNFFRAKRARFSMFSTRDGSIWLNPIPLRWLSRALHTNISPNDFFNDFISIQYKPDKIPPKTFITFSQEQVAQPGNVFLSWNAYDPWRSTPDDQIQYSFRLDMGEWSFYSPNKNHIFLNLKHGEHTFEVKARDRDLNIEPMPAKVIFFVIPPLWKQIWFICLMVFFLIIITVFIIHLMHRNRIIRELSEIRERLFTNISHELRTPLTLIVGNVKKLLESNEHDSRWEHPLGLLQRSCNRLIRLVNQILDFQKLEMGRINYNLKKGDIIAFIYDVAGSFQVLAGEKNKKFTIHSEILELNIWFDSDKIEKILFNLLSNSFKFTNVNGIISLNISKENLKKEEKVLINKRDTIIFDSWLIIEVTDNGIGIAPDKLEKIFDRFYQVLDSSFSHTGGTGIGLALTKELVELQHGKISVSSKKGEGSIFKIKLPIIMDYIASEKKIEYQNNCTRLDLKEIEYNNSKIPRISSIGNTKVLIVEDNFDMRLFIRTELQPEYQVYEAIDGQNGFKAAIKISPDLIISDIMMPNMNGIEFCNKIKTDERTSHIPIILLTAKSSHHNKIEGLETGAIDYITKPFDIQELKIRIQNIILSRQKLWERFQRDIRLQPKELIINSIDEQFLNKAIEIIEEHIDDTEFNPEIFGKEIGMSRAGLYNKIRAITGYSVSDFIIAIRLKRAAQLLKKSGFNVTEVAFEVGFKSSSHFSKAFKKQFGTLPSEYIKQTKI